jgi:hypothetical protein
VPPPQLDQGAQAAQQRGAPLATTAQHASCVRAFVLFRGKRTRYADDFLNRIQRVSKKRERTPALTSNSIRASVRSTAAGNADAPICCMHIGLRAHAKVLSALRPATPKAIRLLALRAPD